MKLSSNKQLLLILVMIAIILGLYVYFRALPEVMELSKLDKRLKLDYKLLKSPDVPDEPDEEADDLENKINQLDDEIEILALRSKSIRKTLPEGDLQDVILKISELANYSQIRIVSNVPLPVIQRVQPTTGSTSKGNQAKKKKKLSAAEQKRLEKKMRKAQKIARKRAKRKQRHGANLYGTLTYEGELMDKLVNEFEKPRPFHSLKIEGQYHNVKAFMSGLQDLPWQITIVEVQFSLLQDRGFRSGAQQLDVSMIIGM